LSPRQFSSSFIALLIALLLGGQAHADPLHAVLGDEVRGTHLKQEAPPEKKSAIKDLKGSTIVHFPTLNRGQRIEGAGYLFMPPGFTPGRPPVPIMFILHGSLGIVNGREDDYAHEFTQMGMAAFIVDSFGPRGITNTVDDQWQISNEDFLRDAFSALNTLSKDPRIDVTRSGVIGFSRGGIIALLSTYIQQRKLYPFIRNRSFAAHYLFYPGCTTHFYRNKTTGAPITFFLAKKDNYTGAAPCVDIASELKLNGADVVTIVYPEVGHDWDIAGTESYPNAEVRLNCRFEQQADGTWNEKASGIKQISPTLRGELYQKALNACITRGTVAQGNPKVRQEAIDTLKALVRKQVIEFKKPKRAMGQEPHP